MQHAVIRHFAVFAILTWASVLAASGARAQSQGVLSGLDADIGGQLNAVRFRQAGSRLAERPRLSGLTVHRRMLTQANTPEEVFSPPPVMNRFPAEELPETFGSPPSSKSTATEFKSSLIEIVEGDNLTMHKEMFPVLSSGSWFRSGRWFVHEDVVMLTRSQARGEALSVTDENSGSLAGREVFLANDTGSFRFEPGARMTLGLLLGRDDKNRDHSLAFTFLGLNQWQTSASATNPADRELVTPLDPNVHVSKLFGNIILADLVPGFVGMSHVYRYGADLRSFEINVRMQDRLGRDQMVYTPDGRWTRHATPRRNWSFLGGIRYINYDEAFSFNSTNPDFLSFGATSGSLDIQSQNNLFGLHVGAEWTEQFETWSWGLRGKLGSFVNFADQQSVIVTTPADAIERARSADDEQLTMLVEFGMIARYQVRPNLALRASYDFMWLQGVALAPEQATFNSAAPEVVNVGGNILFQGGSVGFEMVW
ncbi:MAG: BBP7 family outer membrane beta-barrel protein [Planctomycetes bacterium]|nr:BBP7 family outer membrane beta-barrel protein [Planctomycetota bacterium]